MGTEILPVFLTFAKVLLAAVALIAVFTIGAAIVEHRRAGQNEEVKLEMKGHIINSLLAIVVTLVVYLLLSAIGPVFSLLF